MLCYTFCYSALSFTISYYVVIFTFTFCPTNNNVIRFLTSQVNKLAKGGIRSCLGQPTTGLHNSPYCHCIMDIGVAALVAIGELPVIIKSASSKPGYYEILGSQRMDPT